MIRVSVHEFKRSCGSKRSRFATTIIQKYMKKGSFLDIQCDAVASVLKRTVWSFGSALQVAEQDLRQKDLFREIEQAVYMSLEPSFQEFISQQTSRKALELEQVLENQRLCCVFWLFLFKHKIHQHLSFWMEIETQFKPLLQAQEMPTGTEALAQKYLVSGAPVQLSVVSEEERSVLDALETLLCQENLTVEQQQTLLALLLEAQDFVKENLRVNHFVKFIASDSFRELETEATYETESDTSSNSLLEMMQCLNLSGHQPQRLGRQEFNLDTLEPDTNPISAVLRFHMDLNRDPAQTFVTHPIYQVEATDGEPHRLPENLDAFFVPQGAEMIRSSKPPKFQLYQTSLGCSERTFYAAFLIRYYPVPVEAMGPIEQAMAQTDEAIKLYAPAGLAIFSRYPLLETLKLRLAQVHKDALRTDRAKYLTDATWEPTADQIERLLAPWTPTQGEVNIEELVTKLSLRDLVKLVGAVLLEKKIVIVSSYFSSLSAACEALKRLIQPLLWSHVFAPLLPECMIECLECPTPFIFGLHQAFVTENLHVDDELVLVNLDTCTLSGSDSFHLPEELEEPLLTKLRDLLRPKCTLICQTTGTSAFPQDRIIAIFQDFVKAILSKSKQYSFTLTDGWEQVVVFDEEAFLQSRVVESRDRAFYTAFLSTQLFSQFISTHEVRKASK